MKKKISRFLALLTCMVLLVCCSTAVGEGTEEVTPGLNAYGYYNQEFFRNFDSGIEGAYVDPVYGVLVTPEEGTEYQYVFYEEEAAKIALEQKALTDKLFAGETQPVSEASRRLYGLY